MTRQQVNAIFQTDRLLTTLASDWLDAIKRRDHLAAAKIRRIINDTKQDILESYGIIL